MNCKYGRLFAALILCLPGSSTYAQSADAPYRIESSLIENGTTLIYSYIDGSAYRIGFYDDGTAGRIHWQAIDLVFGENGDISWTPVEGELSSGVQHLYRAIKLDEGVYWIFWPYDPEIEGGSKELITLRIDFNRREIFASSLFNYGENKVGDHLVHFVSGVIHDITQR